MAKQSALFSTCSAAGLLMLLVAATAAAPALRARARPSLARAIAVHPRGQHSTTPDVMQYCKESWFTQTVDHFNYDEPPLGITTFQQRYYICDRYWKPQPNGQTGPIFFYVGNEADVGLYVNNTGLMWESAPSFGALLVFAEHRYYGSTQPFGSATPQHMGWLTSEQAMADYAELISSLKQQLSATGSPVVAFGGSYGGMLASWFRMKYPHIVDGSIAGSAPIMSFDGEEPPSDPNAYANIVTADASAAGGAAPACADNIRQAWKSLFLLAQSTTGLATLSSIFNLCTPLASQADGTALAFWLQNSFDYLSMGNYPYPSPYILNGDGILPAYPMRVACSKIAGTYPADDPRPLLSALRDAVGVFYNYTEQVRCFDITASSNNASQADGLYWDYQYCTEMVQPFARNGVTDMFWSQPWDLQADSDSCFQQWGVRPRHLWATVEWAGWNLGSYSNIVWSNGGLDPWHGTGVLRNITGNLLAVFIPEGAHHLDLMWSNPLDPASVLWAREFERDQMRTWIDAAYARTAPASVLSGN